MAEAVGAMENPIKEDITDAIDAKDVDDAIELDGANAGEAANGADDGIEADLVSEADSAIEVDAAIEPDATNDEIHDVSILANPKTKTIVMLCPRDFMNMTEKDSDNEDDDMNGNNPAGNKEADVADTKMNASTQEDSSNKASTSQEAPAKEVTKDAPDTADDATKLNEAPGADTKQDNLGQVAGVKMDCINACDNETPTKPEGADETGDAKATGTETANKEHKAEGTLTGGVKKGKHRAKLPAKMLRLERIMGRGTPLRVTEIDMVDVLVSLQKNYTRAKKNHCEYCINKHYTKIQALIKIKDVGGPSILEWLNMVDDLPPVPPQYLN